MKNLKSTLRNPQLTIGWLYPELMSTYGDRGNIIVLQKRMERYGINPTIKRINQNSERNDLDDCDLLFMGGAQDIQQEIVNKDLLKNKGDKITESIENRTPGLFICGAYQFLGNYYKDSYGTRIKGLGIFDMHTEAPKNKNRLIGNITAKTDLAVKKSKLSNYLIGFENHGGRTYLSDESQALARVVVGSGNNGEDKTEGIHYLNAIGSYLHGPILPCNPEIADYLIEKAFYKKYDQKPELKNLDDTFAEKAKLNILKRVKASY